MRVRIAIVSAWWADPARAREWVYMARKSERARARVSTSVLQAFTATAVYVVVDGADGAQRAPREGTQMRTILSHPQDRL